MVSTVKRPEASLDLDPVLLDSSEGFDANTYLQVEAKLHHLAPNPTSHFSVTAAIGTKRQLATGNWQSGGAAHEIILRTFPHLASLVALHLSDEDGVPMHAAANARYWAGLTQWTEAKPETLASHLRITVQAATTLAVQATAELAHGLQDDGSITDEAKAAADAVINDAVELMKPRWKAEAEVAIEMLGGLK